MRKVDAGVVDQYVQPAEVRAGLIERVQDPDNRRRLQLSVTHDGQTFLASRPKGSELAKRLERFAASELRAIERAVELLERPTP